MTGVDLTLNLFGVTAETNDRLLELIYPDKDYGCRHEWTEDQRLIDGVVCRKCGMTWWIGHSPHKFAPPTVGEGARVPLDRMIALAHKLWPQSCLAIYANFTLLWLCDGTMTYYRGEGKPPAASAAAILAAVDGKAKE